MTSTREPLQFEWVEDKARSNAVKHKVTFITASAIFENEMIETIDSCDDYGEVRMIALGRVEIEVFHVVYTLRDTSRIRIISARKASKHDRKFYYSQIFP